MSTRRTYEAVARGLNQARSGGNCSDAQEAILRGVNRAAEEVAEELAKDSPRFDRERFLRDAGAKS